MKASLRTAWIRRAGGKFVHLGYEVVALSLDAARELGLEVEDGKDVYAFSGRRGIEVRADELLDRAIEQYPARRPNRVAAEVAAGAIRYYLLKFSLNQIIAFDFDEALRITGDTGVYLQYAHARAAGILRRVADASATIEIPSRCPANALLVHQLDAYKYELNNAAREMAPHLLCTYAFNLAAALSDFYEHTPRWSARRIRLSVGSGAPWSPQRGRRSPTRCIRWVWLPQIRCDQRGAGEAAGMIRSLQAPFV